MAPCPSAKLPSGAEMPLVGLGTWKSKPGEVAAAVEHAIKVGYRHIDCAAVYGNEVEVGAGLKAAFEKGYCKRKDVFVVSKLWNTFHAPEDVEGACKQTLADLGLEYLDLYLIHWPICFKNCGDGNKFPKNEDGSLMYVDVNPTDTWLAMEKLVANGLCKDIGVSNFNSAQIQDILDKGKIIPATNQVENHPYLNQSKLNNFCKEKGIVLTAFSPLGSPDRPWAKPDEPSLLEDPKVVDIAKKYNKTAAQVLLKFGVQRGIVVIPKSVNPARIEQNWDILDFEMSQEDVDMIMTFDCNGRLVCPYTPEGKFRDAAAPHFPFLAEF